MTLDYGQHTTGRCEEEFACLPDSAQSDYTGKHRCSPELTCLLSRGHVWHYGGWRLRRSDGSSVSIRNGEIRDIPRWSYGDD